MRSLWPPPGVLRAKTFSLFCVPEVVLRLLLILLLLLVVMAKPGLVPLLLPVLGAFFLFLVTFIVIWKFLNTREK